MLIPCGSQVFACVWVESGPFGYIILEQICNLRTPVRPLRWPSHPRRRPQLRPSKKAQRKAKLHPKQARRRKFRSTCKSQLRKRQGFSLVSGVAEADIAGVLMSIETSVVVRETCSGTTGRGCLLLLFAFSCGVHCVMLSCSVSSVGCYC